MEWATQWHGPEGKVHADKRTVEYTGRGHHCADAVSFVGALSVGKWVAARAQEAARKRLQHAPCLACPLDTVATPSVSDSKQAAEPVQRAELHVGADFQRETKKNKLRNGNFSGARKTATSSRKKRRVGDKHGVESGESVLQLPLYYFEVQVLATRHFQGHADSEPSLWRHYSGSDDEERNGHDGCDDDDDGDGRHDVDDDDDSEMQDDDGDDSDEVSMEIDLLEHSGRDGTTAPWRGPARRLIHDHLRDTTPGVVVVDSVRSTARVNGAGSNGNRNPVLTESPASAVATIGSEQHRQLQVTENGNGHGRVVRSAFTSLSSSPPPMPTQDQLRSSFPLSASTIQQIRLRLERQHEQTTSHRRRYSSSSGSSTSGAVTLSSAISNIHARQRRVTMRQKRSNHRVSVGFMFSKEGYDYTRELYHEELGRQPCSIAFVGKSGAIMSNGQVFMQTDERFGYGDTVGCGVILDSRTVFWTVNGRLVATIAVNDVQNLDEYQNHSLSDESLHEWITSWADQLLPSVGLHEHGECARALFDGANKERFRFDLDLFKQQQLKERQTSLALYASPSSPVKSQSVRRDEEDSMHQLVEDYFVHFGYGNALSALQSLHRGSHEIKSSSDIASVGFRHTLRQLIYSFKTSDALRELGVSEKVVTKQDPRVLFHCHVLCVVDMLYETVKRRGSALEAVGTAQNVLRKYLPRTNENSENEQEVRAFMSVLLYESVDKIPSSSPGRRYLLWQFREEVADALNDALLGDHIVSCGIETLVKDLAELQRECLTCGASTFPIDSDKSLYYPCGHKREHSHGKKRHSHRRSSAAAMDSDDDNSQDSNSSSSAQSEEEDDDDEDDEDE